MGDVALAVLVAIGVALLLAGAVLAVGVLLDRRLGSAASADEDEEGRCRTG